MLSVSGEGGFAVPLDTAGAPDPHYRLALPHSPCTPASEVLDPPVAAVTHGSQLLAVTIQLGNVSRSVFGIVRHLIN